MRWSGGGSDGARGGAASALVDWTGGRCAGGRCRITTAARPVRRKGRESGRAECRVPSCVSEQDAAATGNGKFSCRQEQDDVQVPVAARPMRYPACGCGPPIRIRRVQELPDMVLGFVGLEKQTLVIGLY